MRKDIIKLEVTYYSNKPRHRIGYSVDFVQIKVLVGDELRHEEGMTGSRWMDHSTFTSQYVGWLFNGSQATPTHLTPYDVRKIVHEKLDKITSGASEVIASDLLKVLNMAQAPRQ